MLLWRDVLVHYLDFKTIQINRVEQSLLLGEKVRAYEFLSERQLDEGGDADVIRYNSEIGVLVAFAGITAGDSDPTKKAFDNGNYDSALGDPESVHSHVNRFLIKGVYSESEFKRWIGIGKEMYRRISADVSEIGRDGMPTLFGWVGGSNAGPVADIEFMDNRLSGISLKGEGGITLSNMSPKHLGLIGERNVDIVQFYTKTQGNINAFVNLKKRCMIAVMKEAIAEPGVPKTYKSSGRSIVFNKETSDFNIVGKSKKQYNNWTSKDILAGSVKNADWQRVFGDWFIQNFHGGDGTVKKLMKPVATAVSNSFTKTIRDHLANDKNLKSVLQIEDIPYYYANDNKLYFVPEFKSGSLEAKSVTYMDADGTGQKWKLTVGHISAEPEDCATVEIYIRWRNGMFESNATASAQNLENAEGMAWIEVSA